MTLWKRIVIGLCVIPSMLFYSTTYAFGEGLTTSLRQSIASYLVELGVLPVREPFSDVLTHVRPYFADLMFLQRERSGALVKRGGASAFAVGSHGLLATSKHVIENDKYTDDIILKASINGRMYDARVVFKDPVLDIALLEVDYYFDSLPSFTSLESVLVGDEVFALGNALGEYDGTVARGSVVAKNRSVVAKGDGTEHTLAGVLQTDLNTTKGYSGGPLFNERGDVLGMNAAIDVRAAGISFAIPSLYLQQIAEQYMSHGRVTRPYLGLRFIALNPSIAAVNELSISEGAIIIGKNGDAGVVKGSPAEKAGFQLGDVIVRFNGVVIDRETNLLEAVATASAGDTVIVQYMRGDNLRETRLTLSTLPSYFSENSVEFVK